MSQWEIEPYKLKKYNGKIRYERKLLSRNCVFSIKLKRGCSNHKSVQEAKI